MTDAGPTTGAGRRHELFETARRRAGLSLPQMWLRYLALGGTCDALDLEAFLHGLMPLAPIQQDMLAHAVNERLFESYEETAVPYLLTSGHRPAAQTEDPLAVIDELLHRRP